MSIPYRTRQTIKGFLVAVLVIAVISALCALCWFLWVSRFLVYSRDQGAYFDFDQPGTFAGGELAVEPSAEETISIYYNDGQNAISSSTELEQLNGYYISAQALETDFASIMPQLEAIEDGTAIMVDVKSIQGNFFYSSKVAEYRNSDIDTEAMDDLLDYLKRRDLYLIARLPAFRDFNYGLNHVSDGLPTPGGWLWMDSANSYWLNPASSGTINYLTSIVVELQTLGFDEVVFYDFCFPSTDQIVFSGDRDQTIVETAQKLVDTCATHNFAVSFAAGTNFVVPEGRTRLYLQNISATQVSATADMTAVVDKTIGLVFITELHDTRFDEFSVLRPLDSAH